MSLPDDVLVEQITMLKNSKATKKNFCNRISCYLGSMRCIAYA